MRKLFVLLGVMSFWWSCGDSASNNATNDNANINDNSNTNTNDNTNTNTNTNDNTNTNESPYSVVLELSTQFTFLGVDTNRVEGRCVVRDASHLATSSSGISVTLTADASAVDNGDGSWSFAEDGEYSFSCTGADAQGGEYGDQKTVLVAMDILPDHWVRGADRMFINGGLYDRVLEHLSDGDGTEIHAMAFSMDESRAQFASLMNNSRLEATYPLPEAMPSASVCADAGHPLSADDALITARLDQVAAEVTAVRGVLATIDPADSEADMAPLRAAALVLQSAIVDFQNLVTTPCGVFSQMGAYTALMKEQVLPLLEELSQFSSLNLHALGDYLDVGSSLKFSLMGISTTLSVQGQLNSIVTNLYGPYFKVIAIYAATMFLADMVNAYWDPVPGGPFIHGDITSGGLVDVCDGFALNTFWGEQFSEGNHVPDNTSVGVLVVASAQVAAIEGIFDAVSCAIDDCTGSVVAVNLCKAKKYFNCKKGIEMAIEDAMGVYDDVSPSMVSITAGITANSIEFTFAIPYQVTSMIGIEPIYLFPWSAITGHGERWHGNFISCP